VVAIEVDRDLIDGLITAGLLSAWDENDRGAIAQAVARFLLLARNA
jgi:hypothetical protein